MKFQLFLTLTALCISERFIKMNINLYYFYFRTSVLCLKRFYEDL